MTNRCERCGREIVGYKENHERGNLSNAAYCYVVHDYSGCDSGCCGHTAYLCDKEDHEIASRFVFEHPYGVDEKEWIAALLGGVWCQVAIDFEKCRVLDD